MHAPRELLSGAVLLEKSLGASVDFLGAKVFFVSREKPNMAERIFQRTGAVSIKLVLNRSHRLRARAEGLRK